MARQFDRRIGIRIADMQHYGNTSGNRVEHYLRDLLALAHCHDGPRSIRARDI